jgi:hypothetical protein
MAEHTEKKIIFRSFRVFRVFASALYLAFV